MKPKPKPKAISTFPAVGSYQISLGTLNGCWGCWYTFDGIPQKFKHQSSRDNALAMYEDCISVIKAERASR